jgi:hypothetical protein
MLRIAYAAVRCWQQDGVEEEIERELRAEAEVAISRASSLFMVLIRSALPRLDANRASKWAGALEVAAHYEVRSKRLGAFLHVSGGIEGAARERARPRTRSREVRLRDRRTFRPYGLRQLLSFDLGKFVYKP